MIKIENVDVFGWEAAIRGMRNPMNSWDKSDSFPTESGYELYRLGAGEPEIGENDLKLMKNLSKAGDDHGKFLRMLNVTLDVTAPLYFYKEFDTYKVGTVANSCSTMHKIHAKEFTVDDFSYDKLILNAEMFDYKGRPADPKRLLIHIVDVLNVYRNLYLETKDKTYWWQMIQLLPSSYNQKRTVQLNYQVLKSMYFARRNHKLDEWREFCKWCEELPYFKEIVIQED